MAEIYETKQLTERVILVGVSFMEGEDTEQSLDELEELAYTAGAQTVGRLIQNREAPHPGTYLGKGKIEELREQIWEADATGIICDDELSPAQLANLQDLLDTKVMDRTLIILDIFAQRASTREGRFRLSWLSSVTDPHGLRVWEDHFHVLAAVLVREAPVKRNWKWTAG